MRLASAGFLLLGLALGAAAAQTLSKAVDAKQRANVRAQVFDDSLSLFAAHDYENAVNALVANNIEKSGTLAWSLETANKLTQMALYFRLQHDYRTTLAVANRALGVLRGTVGTSSALSAPSLQQAQVGELAGFIYEDIFHDLDSAKANYQQALTVNPASKKASDALARIALMQAKIKDIGGAK